MPIALAPANENLTIHRISGPEKIRLHLKNLGFIEGEPIRLVSKIDKNVIVKIKGVTLAITHDLAKNIYV